MTRHPEGLGKGDNGKMLDLVRVFINKTSGRYGLSIGMFPHGSPNLWDGEVAQQWCKLAADEADEGRREYTVHSQEQHQAQTPHREQTKELVIGDWSLVFLVVSEWESNTTKNPT
ncbi:hypothetical protein MKZ38_008409 [Zalerion maritima]|uniref:Uncharacterized protein n=1 Tax=Zalerion maritima TaxID=339359 RepID=A0AAD5RKW8_9PEZI|nr:hypothetical protein MKZ38_008409 [Zalerion maritima]